MSFLVSRRDQTNDFRFSAAPINGIAETGNPGVPLGQLQSRPVCSEFASGVPAT
ncbi:Hypothetical protein OINT_1002407 [Brucella intermedia LMG 3301]|uniref:Uncharacterized protein n=2 Tax=Brucella intermedia TaxID=94625 RepID=U4V6G9_9HYPH|nr:Hypothetical protein OINT_1002407 [Brucella intermedia LMG 3301]ERM01585.1 hypothetical protein Q644_03175 [Brucella intermedia 229E]